MIIDFDLDPVRSCDRWVFSVVVFLFPAIVALIVSITGVIRIPPIEEIRGGIFGVMVCWIVIEALLCFYFLREMENKKDIIKRLFLNWGLVNLLLNYHVSDYLESGLSIEDSDRIQYAGIAFFSMMVPLAFLLIFWLWVLLVYLLMLFGG